MSLHWENKRKRTESTIHSVSVADAFLQGGEGVDANLSVAGVHYGKWAAYTGAEPHEIARQTNLAEAEFRSVEALCESPIERRLLPWLIFEDYGLSYQVAKTYNWKEDKAPFHAPLLIIPQFAILRFRVDFMVIKRRKDDNGCVMVAVECDGFKYHSTPRDMQRDGHLAMMGVRTVRASGESITADPRGVAGRVAEAVMVGE